MESKITNGFAINIVCDFCAEGPVYGNPKVLRFADLERFFCCCNPCKRGYGEKYRGGIESINRKCEGNKPEMEI